MATFYKCINNGTCAIMSEETHEALETWWSLVPEARAVQPYPTPIFTFVRTENYETDPSRRSVTGDYGTMDSLLDGHTIVDGDFYVPFSNHDEMQGSEVAERELRFRTTLADAIKSFGLMPVGSIRVS